MAVATFAHVSFAYPDAREPALRNVSLDIFDSEIVAVLGPSGSGKSTFIRALAGLVPHFHGGRFEGRVVVDGLDTRQHRPADLAGTVASVFQDPEDQVVLQRVEAEVAFGLENLGVEPERILLRARTALADVGASHLAERRVSEISCGELQRVCLASALALDPRLLLLDEPTSQLDPDGAEAFLDLALSLGVAVVCSEQRPARLLARADRVLFFEHGQVVLDESRDVAVEWLAENRPEYIAAPADLPEEESSVAELVCRVDNVSFAYAGTPPVVAGKTLELRRSEIVALVGPNGVGKTTLGKLAAGLLEPQTGSVDRRGRAGYLLQDPGRFLLRERADEEVALSVGGDLHRARAALAAVGLEGHASSHPLDLSTGERERLALAAVLVTEPDLLVLDEPTRGVDPERKRDLVSLLQRDSAARATLVITHDLDFAAAVADRAVSLGAPRELAHA